MYRFWKNIPDVPPLKSKAKNFQFQTQNEQKEIVLIALGGKSANSISNQTNNQFFQAVQKEITISDFQKFAANEKVLTETKSNIKNEFTEITREKRMSWKKENSKLLMCVIESENLHQTYQNIQQAEENRLLTDSARKAFESSSRL